MALDLSAIPGLHGFQNTSSAVARTGCGEGVVGSIRVADHLPRAEVSEMMWQTPPAGAVQPIGGR